MWVNLTFKQGLKKMTEKQTVLLHQKTLFVFTSWFIRNKMVNDDQQPVDLLFFFFFMLFYWTCWFSVLEILMWWMARVSCCKHWKSCSMVILSNPTMFHCDAQTCSLGPALKTLFSPMCWVIFALQLWSICTFPLSCFPLY